jgi:hypothetical protein
MSGNAPGSGVAAGDAASNTMLSKPKLEHGLLALGGHNRPGVSGTLIENDVMFDQPSMDEKSIVAMELNEILYDAPDDDMNVAVSEGSGGVMSQPVASMLKRLNAPPT